MRPARERRVPALEPPKQPRPVTRQTPPQRPAFQYPLYLLLIMMTVLGLAMAPASYLFRGAATDRGNRSVAMILMLVGPLLAVVFLSTAYRLAKYFRRS